MPIRDRVTWGAGCPFADRRLQDLDKLVIGFRSGRLPPHWKGNKEWENRWHDLPPKPPLYYREFYVGTSQVSGELRIVLGRMGEVFISGNHHRDWRQVIGLPISPVSW